jgi:Carboxypeptidase regulatory-like domain
MQSPIQRTSPLLTHRRRFGACCVAVCATALLSTIATSAHAQSLSLSGSLWIYQPNARPLPVVGYKVYLYNKQSGWSRPSYTDSSGRYAHYGVRPDKYLLHIRDSQNKVMWQQDVVVNSGQTQVPWIILPKG